MGPMKPCWWGTDLRRFTTWATGMSAGPAAKSGQTITFHTSISGTSVVSVTVMSYGDLTFTTSPTVTGDSTIQVWADRQRLQHLPTTMESAPTFTIHVVA